MKKLVSLVCMVLIVVLYSGAVGAPGVHYHFVKKDENIGVIAKKYGLSYRIVARANKLKPPYIIHPEDRLVIPTASVKKKIRGFRKGGLSRWIFPGQNKFFGGCEKGGKDPVKVKSSLRRQLGEKSKYGHKYVSVISVFERRIDNKDYVMKDIEPGEFFNSMEFTRNGKTEIVYDLVADWDKEYVRKNNIPSDAERYVERFGNEEITFTLPYACCNPAIRIRRLPSPPPIVPPVTKPPEKGKIVVKKEAIDFKDNPILPVPQFTFTLDGGLDEEKNDSSGEAVFEVDSGFHTVDEPKVEGWEELPGMPRDGRVEVKAGQTVVVLKKNRQVLPPRHPTPVPVPTPAPTPSVTPEQPYQEPLEPEKEPEPEPKIEMDRWELESEFNGVLGQWKRTGGKLGDLDLRGNFFSADEIIWYHACKDCAWRYGIGFVAGYGEWKADFGRGRSYWIGPQGGAKFFEPTGEGSYRLGEIKIRPFTFDVSKFDAKFSNDETVQRSLIPELRLGYEWGQKRNRPSLNPERMGVFLNLRVPVSRDKHFNSQTRSTRPDGLTNVFLGGWAQWGLLDYPNLALRATIGPNFQEWEENRTGLFAGATIRYEGPIFDLMVGPFVNIPFGPNPSSLLGIAGQVELRNGIQFAYRKARERKLTKVDSPEGEKIKAFEDDTPSEREETVSLESGKTQTQMRSLEREIIREVKRLELIEASWPEVSESSKMQTVAFSGSSDGSEVANSDFHESLD